MSNIIDNIGCAYEKAKDFVEEHPWQAAAIAAMPLVGIGAVALAGEAAAIEAAKKALPALTIGEGAALGAGVLAAAGGIMAATEGVATATMGPAGLIGIKAAEAAVKAAGEAVAKHGIDAATKAH
jgi:ethanolamine utilization protein EutA (predicted chaperonin)